MIITTANTMNQTGFFAPAAAPVADMHRRMRVAMSANKLGRGKRRKLFK
jgi:hypothetical protein